MEPKKKKIGLCISFLGTSYGMLLQAYATQYIIEKLGYNKTHYLIHRLIKLNTTNIYKT